jgi:hypothetical protein
VAADSHERAYTAKLADPSNHPALKGAENQGPRGTEMNASMTGERRASQQGREYTPHEHEELRALAQKSRERAQRLALAIRGRATVSPPVRP